MNVKKAQRWCLDLSKHFCSIDNWILLFFSWTLLSVSANKAMALEEDRGMSQINNVRQLELKEDLNSLEDNEMSQINNVQQLRDVAPTDWAYEALRSLVDRYGCISGFPNQTYRGSQPLSRYEFAAGLNSCLNQIERLISSSDSVEQSDIETVQRLSQEFEAELATIGGKSR